jgi:hypothetical protein
MQGILAIIHFSIFYFTVSNLKINVKVYRAVILPVLYGCET